MKILSSKSNNLKLQASQQVNRVGDYLYKNIDGAFKKVKTGNMCDVYFMILYQVPKLQRRFGHPEDREMNEMHINLNITTYQNKIRVNVLEVSPEERTLGSYVFSPEMMSDLPNAKKVIYDKVVKRVSKVYEEYDFIF